MSVSSLDTSTKLAQAACDRRKDQFSISLPFSPPPDSDTESPDSQSFGVTHTLEFSMPVNIWGQPEKKPYEWDLIEIKPVWNWACDAPQGDLLFHRDHSPVSSAQGHLFHLCRDTVGLLETGY